MITRETYLKKLRQLKNQNLIKVITGIRRCGKSTILEAFKNELLSNGVYSKNIVFLNFEKLINGLFTNKNTDQLFRKYINASCFPEAVTLAQNNRDLVNDYLQSIYDTVIINDIAQRYKLRNIHNLHRVISFVFDSVGSYISPTNIVAGLNRNSQKKYHITLLSSCLHC